LAKALPSFCHFLSPPAKAGGNSVFVFQLPTALQEDCVGKFLGICNSKTIPGSSLMNAPSHRASLVHFRGTMDQIVGTMMHFVRTMDQNIRTMVHFVRTMDQIV
jgi:hypothetical protein